MESKINAKADKLKAMGHPTRLQIIEGLLVGPLNVGEVQDLTGVEKANASQHLHVLFHAGLVEAERKGTTKEYHIRREALQTVRAIVEAL